MYGRDTCPPVGTMTEDEKEKEIVRRSKNGLLRAVRHFEGSKHLQSSDIRKKDSGARFFVDVWSKPGFQSLIKELHKKHCGVNPVKEKPEEEEPKNDRAEFAK